MEKNQSLKKMNVSDAAYIAGLFDGEGHVQYKQYLDGKRKDRPKRYKVWRISLEMSMTDEDVIRWVHEVTGVGTVRLNVKNKSPSSKPHWKDQWRWRCSHRDALKIAKLMWPYTQVKLHKIEQIIDHYEPDIQDLDDNMIDIETEREYRKQWPFK